jgi:hypothetical protein
MKDLSVDKADALLRAALRGDEGIFEALMVTPTASLPKQAQAAQTLNAFLLEAATPEEE